MINIKIFGIIIFLVIVCATFGMRADAASLNNVVSLSRWEDRANTFYAVVGNIKDKHNYERVRSLNDKTREDLINLLIFEVYWMKKYNAQSDSENYEDYYADLIAAVSLLKDSDIMNALLLDEVLNSGSMATTGLARLGDRAFPRIAEKIKKTSSAETRLSLVMVLEDMLKHNALKRNRVAAQRILVRLTGDTDMFVSAAATRALTYGDPEIVIPVLRRLASLVVVSPSVESGQDMVVSEARDALNKLLH